LARLNYWEVLSPVVVIVAGELGLPDGSWPSLLKSEIMPGNCKQMCRWTAVVLLSAAWSMQPALAADKPFKVEETTIAQIQTAIKNKQLTSVELVNLYLKRIKAYNGPGVEEPQGILGPTKTIAHAKGVNALGTLNLRPATRKAWGFDDRKARSMSDALDADPNMPDALETAAELDAYFAKTGKLKGPLHGVVMSIKDQYDTVDMRTTSGADAAYANDRPPSDATFVKRLRAAGAIILAKSNMGEYASGFRSAFGGTIVNPYDTERVPGGSSGGSAVSVAANLVTVAISEESGPSVRAPAEYANLIGLAPTQELVSRVGMFNIGLNTRVGPTARTVEDMARVLSVIAGYDPQDELTAFSVGRTPDKPYESFTHEKSLQGVRIGVVREYMDPKVFSGPLYAANIELVNKAIADLKKLGATIVEPPPEGLFTAYIKRYLPQLRNAAYTKSAPDLFPVDASGKPTHDHVGTLIDLAMDPSKVPGTITLRDIAPAPTVGESKYGFNLYLRQRGDANIKTIDDLIAKSKFFVDPYEGDKKATLINNNKPMLMDSSARTQLRFAIQQILAQAMAEQKLDAVVYPTGLLPPRKINTPRDPSFNGVGNYGMWTFLGVQGFPAITVPAGFTTEVWDRVPDANAPKKLNADGEAEVGEMKIVGPVQAKLPVGVDFLGMPFSEPMLLKIAAAYEAATHHRQAPADFGPLK
jgi:Asp-tRNA(Asn)/Glu-tRNA(Gln) amidotransferase A subunit family amidase